jgi:hypothetical protein
LGLIPQTAALIFAKATHFKIIFDRLIGSYYFLLLKVLAEVAYFFYY